MNKNEMEKEIRLLEGKNRDIRNKNSDLQSENNRLFNDKINIEKDINDAFKRSVKAREERKQAEDSLVEIKSKIKNELYEVAKKKAALDQEDRKLKDLSQLLAIEQDSIRKEKLELANVENNIKQKSVELQKEAANLIEAKKRLAEEALKIKEAWKNIEDSQHKLKEQAKDSMDNFLKSEDNCSKSKELLLKAREKSDQVDKTILNMKDKEDNLIKRENELNVWSKTLEKIGKTNQDEVDRLKAKEQSLDKALNGLSMKEKEIEVRRLRVEKIVREKGITEELTRLEEDLK